MASASASALERRKPRGIDGGKMIALLALALVVVAFGSAAGSR
jgi:hypothetical protein